MTSKEAISGQEKGESEDCSMEKLLSATAEFRLYSVNAAIRQKLMADG